MALIDFIPEGWVPDCHGARAASRLRTGDAGEMLLRALAKATPTGSEDHGLETVGAAAVALSQRGWEIAGVEVALAWQYAVARHREAVAL